MISKKTITKINLRKKRHQLIDNILNPEKLDNLELKQLLQKKPLKQHQLYSKRGIILFDDEEKYNGFIPTMSKYNKIHYENISKYERKKQENKNFLKQYTGYKIFNHKICKDDVDTLYGNLLPLYKEKYFSFTNQFLFKKKIFQESASLINNRRHLNDYYQKMEQLNDNKSIRDLTFLNKLSLELEANVERRKLKSLQGDYIKLEKLGMAKKNHFFRKLAKIKRTKEYKQKRYIEAMKALDQFTKNKDEIEKDKQYNKNIINLIEIEEKENEKEKQKEIEVTNINNNQSSNNLENDDNNSLFILNRYQNDKYNNKINSSNIFPRNKSSINVQSSLYNEINNTTNNKNIETKQTMLNNYQMKTMKRNSVNSNLYFSKYTLNDTQENNNTEFPYIKDTYTNENPINCCNNLKKTTNNEKSTQFDTRYKSKNVSSIKIEKYDDSSNISNNDFYNSNNYFISDYANISTQKRGRNSNKVPIRKIKSTFDISNFSYKIKENEKNAKNLSVVIPKLNEKEKKDLKVNTFKNLKRLNLYVYTRNNRKFKKFCDMSNSFMPQNITDKINKSFELDEEIKKGHIEYAKLLLEQKISAFYDKKIYD